MLTDTHAHLTDPQLAVRLDAVIAEAAAAGVSRIINVATDVRTAEAAAMQTLGRPALYCTAGIHPHHAATVEPDWLARIETAQSHPRCVAVGEIGLDYYYDFAPRPVQAEVFSAQLRLARRIGRPAIIHSRGKVLSDRPGEGRLTDPACFTDIITVIDAVNAEVMSGAAPLRGVFHCFEGTSGQAAEVLSRGLHVSFTGSLTFKSNDALRRTAAGLPIDRVMVETDTPYMSPEPYRKVRPCTPAMVVNTASRLADVLGVGLAELMARSSATAAALFGLEGA